VAAQEIGEERQGVSAVLPGRAEDGHEDRFGLSAGRCPSRKPYPGEMREPRSMRGHFPSVCSWPELTSRWSLSARLSKRSNARAQSWRGGAPSNPVRSVAVVTPCGCLDAGGHRPAQRRSPGVRTENPIRDPCRATCPRLPTTGADLMVAGVCWIVQEGPRTSTAPTRKTSTLESSRVGLRRYAARVYR